MIREILIDTVLIILLSFICTKLTLMHERVDVKKLQTAVILAVSAYHEGRFPFENGDSNPEASFVRIIGKIAAEINSPMLNLNALFLVTSCVYSETTVGLFERISSEANIRDNLWIFDPRKVVKKGERLTTGAVLDFIQPQGYNAKALKQWHHNSLILHHKYDNSITNFFSENNYDAEKIYNALVVKPQKKGKEGFRGYGEKLSALFLQWVSRYELCKLEGDAGVPIDFQVGRIPFQVKAIETNRPIHKNTVTAVLRPAFKQITENSNITSAEISQAFYTIGSVACRKKTHDKCPLREVCSTLVSRKLLDRKGVFEPGKPWK